MKKLGFCFLVIFIMFLVVSCSNNQNNNELNDNGQNEINNDNVENNEDVDLGENNNNNKEDFEVDSNNEVENETSEEDVIDVVEPLYEMSGERVVPIDDAPENIVLLTIDDSFLSSNDYALEMAEIMVELDAGAIFFVNGQRLQSEEDRAKLLELHNMGFEIGNHSMTHPNFSQISEEQQRNEIVELNDIIEEITGERPRFFRAPFGRNTDTSKAVVEEEGMQWMNWSYGYDWMPPYIDNPEGLAKIMVEPDPPSLLSNGANLLMHDRWFTRDALEEIVIGLREKGFEIVDPAFIK